jgi:hypothetical protein
MAQAVSCRPLTGEARRCARICHCRICGQGVTGKGISPRSSVSPSQYNSTRAAYSYTTWGWTIGPLLITVQKHSFTPSTWRRVYHHSIPCDGIVISRLLLICYGYYLSANRIWLTRDECVFQGGLSSVFLRIKHTFPAVPKGQETPPPQFFKTNIKFSYIWQ